MQTEERPWSRAISVSLPRSMHKGTKGSQQLMARAHAFLIQMQKAERTCRGQFNTLENPFSDQEKNKKVIPLRLEYGSIEDRSNAETINTRPIEKHDIVRPGEMKQAET